MSLPVNDKLKIAVVGDIHDLWDDADKLALNHLNVDLVLFVGDFGNESVEVVKKIAAVELPKAAIMGNHDAWYTASSWGRKQAPYDRTLEDRVQQQLDLLGKAHVGFSHLDFPQFNLSVVGSRPFSWGGLNWKNADFYRDRYEVNNFGDSTTRIVEAAKNTAFDTVIFIGHNGPLGLGDKPEDICGRDWQLTGGDFGDPDLTEAIAKTIALGKSIPLVTFGHMHHSLRHRQDRLRTRIKVDRSGTIYLNSASVPRLKRQREELKRNFSLVSLNNGTVKQVSLVWLGENFNLVSEEILYRQDD
ncbi:TIGR04168 family protein [Myxosarcina sp. GI1(2024)]